ncbi:hypothetical protein L665_00179 [Ralstonia solanacearum SD54]|nr:hypothetical protein L665_00179 [Ralstonia solanacearum SD54]
MVRKDGRRQLRCRGRRLRHEGGRSCPPQHLLPDCGCIFATERNQCIDLARALLLLAGEVGAYRGDTRYGSCDIGRRRKAAGGPQAGQPQGPLTRGNVVGQYRAGVVASAQGQHAVRHIGSERQACGGGIRRARVQPVLGGIHGIANAAEQVDLPTQCGTDGGRATDQGGVRATRALRFRTGCGAACGESGGGGRTVDAKCGPGFVHPCDGLG